MAIDPHLRQPTEEAHQKQEEEEPFQDLNFMEDKQIDPLKIRKEVVKTNEELIKLYHESGQLNAASLH